MNTNIAINGFGRIGRVTLRSLMEKGNLRVQAINDLTDIETMAYLLKYDSVHGPFPGEIKTNGSNLIINGQQIPVYAEKDPANLPWESLGVDVVLESTGKFRKKEEAALHLDAGAKKVILSAPPKGTHKQEIPNVVLGVNDKILEQEHPILSNASCTTNCLAPMVKVLDDYWGIENGLMTTVHAYTSTQNLQDGPSPKDLRRARAATQNIIPTSTGATDAIGEVIPALNGKLTGMAMRVPVIDGSITDLNCTLKKKATVDEINQAFAKEASDQFTGIIGYNDDEIVSSDIIGNDHSCVFDAASTQVVGNMVKVIGWYDNEKGYSARCAELMEKVVEKPAMAF